MILSTDTNKTETVNMFFKMLDELEKAGYVSENKMSLNKNKIKNLDVSNRDFIYVLSLYLKFNNQKSQSKPMPTSIAVNNIDYYESLKFSKQLIN